MNGPVQGFELPPPVGALLGRLPALPGSMLLAAALNRILLPRLPADVRATLRQRRLRVEVRDAWLVFDLLCTDAGFAACPPGEATDLTINARAHDFLRLARREEDADTLFFGRHLRLQGDTELGLVVKNTLDALEAPLLEPPAWLRERLPGRVQAWLAAGRRAP